MSQAIAQHSCSIWCTHTVHRMYFPLWFSSVWTSVSESEGASASLPWHSFFHSLPLLLRLILLPHLTSLPLSFTLSSSCQSLILHLHVCTTCMCVYSTACVWDLSSRGMAECSGPEAVMCHGAQSDDGDTCQRSFRLLFSTNLSLSLKIVHTHTIPLHLLILYVPLSLFSCSLLLSQHLFSPVSLHLFLSFCFSPPFPSLNIFFPNTSVLHFKPL